MNLGQSELMKAAELSLARPVNRCIPWRHNPGTREHLGVRVAWFAGAPQRSITIVSNLMTATSLISVNHMDTT